MEPIQQGLNLCTVPAEITPRGGLGKIRPIPAMCVTLGTGLVHDGVEKPRGFILIKKYVGHVRPPSRPQQTVIPAFIGLRNIPSGSHATPQKCETPGQKPGVVMK
ncbi:hypothetical protein cauri_0458 [Corynebacterium aurimucosum ATCC 700975]|uniref:Uncharacterized protein n=1 Tax=Corynebacterium aurimucosum (strain ATCC 700975 / DSM 44827 / CIP 107346 / CN-1) TaxID=548476 RepID=C3PL51_CORA7|nr:hypothetical protein cauri_0458 [Corynebacterium aurimucosum ATCC 700975]